MLSKLLILCFDGLLLVLIIVNILLEFYYDQVDGGFLEYGRKGKLNFSYCFLLGLLVDCVVCIRYRGVLEGVSGYFIYV